METLHMFIILYPFACYAMWNYFRIAYSEKGIWSTIKKDSADIFMNWCPILNVICALIGYLLYPPYKKGK